MRRPFIVLSPLLIVTALTTVPVESQPQRLCAIDMGSNSFRRIVGSFAGGRYEQARVEVATLGVGDDLAKNGSISDAKLAEIDRTLAGFKRSCDKEGVARTLAVGTAAFREAPKHGVTMEIASERRESELAYLVGSLGQDGFAVIDNGSRSIELVARQGRDLRYRVFNLGYRVAYEQYFAPASRFGAAAAAFENRLKQEVPPAAFMRGHKRLVGIEFGEMAAVLFAPGELEGRVFTLRQLKQKLTEVAGSGPDGFPALKKRKDIDRALPRLVVAAYLMEAFGYDRIELTARELGTGLIIETGIAR
jgi:exopolyphosphatase/pppGpp-phosphohydrolase